MEVRKVEGKRRGTYKNIFFSEFQSSLLSPSLNFQFPGEHVVESRPSSSIVFYHALQFRISKYGKTPTDRKKKRKNTQHNEIWNYMCTHSTFNGVIRRVKCTQCCEFGMLRVARMRGESCIFSKITRATAENKHKIEWKWGKLICWKESHSQSCVQTYKY